MRHLWVFVSILWSHVKLFFLTCMLDYCLILYPFHYYDYVKDVPRSNLTVISILLSSFNFVYQWHIPWRCHVCLMWTFFWWSYAEESHRNSKQDSFLSQSSRTYIGYSSVLRNMSHCWWKIHLCIWAICGHSRTYMHSSQ